LPASQGGGTAFVEQLRQPFYSQFPWIGAVRYFSNLGYSRYNSMQITLTKRPTHGLNFTASYVLAKASDLAAGLLGSSNFTDNYNPSADYGPTNVDPRNRFTLTSVYALPNRKAPLQMLSGWRINNVLYLMSRIPWTTNDTTDDTSGTGVKMDKWSLFGVRKTSNGATFRVRAQFLASALQEAPSLAPATAARLCLRLASMPPQGSRAIQRSPRLPPVR